MNIRKEERRNKANEMAIAREGRTPAQQIQRLDAKLGVGVGAKKERARLQAQMANES